MSHDQFQRWDRFYRLFGGQYDSARGWIQPDLRDVERSADWHIHGTSFAKMDAIEQERYLTWQELRQEKEKNRSLRGVVVLLIGFLIWVLYSLARH